MLENIDNKQRSRCASGVKSLTIGGLIVWMSIAPEVFPRLSRQKACQRLATGDLGCKWSISRRGDAPTQPPGSEAVPPGKRAISSYAQGVAENYIPFEDSTRHEAHTASGSLKDKQDTFSTLSTASTSNVFEIMTLILHSHCTAPLRYLTANHTLCASPRHH